MSTQVLLLWPLSSDALEIHIGPQESEATRFPRVFPTPQPDSTGWARARQDSPSPGPQTSPVTAEPVLWMDEQTDGLTDVQGRGRKTDPTKAGGRGTGTEGPSSHMQASRLLKR